jgi:DNA polymerase-1
MTLPGMGALMLTEADTALLKDYSLVTDPQDTPEVLNTIDSAPYYSFDLETTGLDWVRSEIHGIALGTENKEWYVTHGAAKAIMPDLVKIINNPNKLLVGHNLKFDFHFIEKYGADPKYFLDTMIAQFLIDENQQLSLKAVARNILGLDDKLPDFKQLLTATKKAMKMKRNDQVSIYDIPIDVLGTYAGRDARINYDIMESTLQGLKREGMDEIYWDKEMPFLKVLLGMEAAGMYIDQSRSAEVRKELQEIVDENLEKWKELSGNANPNSPDQVAHYLYDVCGYEVTKWTDTNKPSVNKLSLLRIQREHQDPAVAALQNYRKISKLITTYIDSWNKTMFDGRIFGSYNLIGAKTSRLSSSNPHLQNIPAHGMHGAKLREIIAAPPGYALLVADYSQVELRLLTHYSMDPVMLEVYMNNGDIHATTAERVGVERFQAKSLNFGWVYGMGWKSLQDDIEEKGYPRPSAKDAKAWMSGYDATYSTAASWKTRALAYGRKLGGVHTIWGKKRRLPELRAKDENVRSRAERQAVNAIIQGSAANLIEYAMLELDQPARDFGGKMLSQVHDEIVFEVPIDVTAEFGELVKNKMEEVTEIYDLRVPIISEYDVGSNWGEGKH